ncbi:MAG: DUF488 domain-containing protein [Saprospiraceae bacterium]|nr:DUF488 domain-containing protein [Saprospiraceae bacterium]MCZ2338340.1 DUF488 domain-containing protein [Chitinophagales bacterium]
MYAIKIKRVYEPPLDDDGFRVLVDRLWPRGISKVSAAINEWNKEVAPSNELRKWFDHVPERFEAFKTKYIEELNHKKDQINHLKSLAENQPLTLVYSAKDEKHNQAVVLQLVLNQKQ